MGGLVPERAARQPCLSVTKIAATRWSLRIVRVRVDSQGSRECTDPTTARSQAARLRMSPVAALEFRMAGATYARSC